MLSASSVGQICIEEGKIPDSPSNSGDVPEITPVKEVKKIYFQEAYEALRSRYMQTIPCLGVDMYIKSLLHVIGDKGEVSLEEALSKVDAKSEAGELSMYDYRELYRLYLFYHQARFDLLGDGEFAPLLMTMRGVLLPEEDADCMFKVVNTIVGGEFPDYEMSDEFTKILQDLFNTKNPLCMYCSHILTTLFKYMIASVRDDPEEYKEVDKLQEYNFFLIPIVEELAKKGKEKLELYLNRDPLDPEEEVDFTDEVKSFCTVALIANGIDNLNVIHGEKKADSHPYSEGLELSKE